MVLCDCLSSFKIENNEVSSANILLYHHKYFFQEELGLLKLPAVGENVDNLQLVLANQLRHRKNAI